MNVIYLNIHKENLEKIKFKGHFKKLMSFSQLHYGLLDGLIGRLREV